MRPEPPPPPPVRPEPPPPPPVRPEPPPVRPEPPAPVFDSFAEIGLLDLSEDVYEYVTGDEVWAQRFELRQPLQLWEAQLALQKFGGADDGAIWVEIRSDENGVPSDTLRMESAKRPIAFLAQLPEFTWVSFNFRFLGPERAVLQPGEYWLVFRATQDAIINWHSRVGNPYLGPEDTRSRPRDGKRWSNLAHVDFNFLLTGLE